MRSILETAPEAIITIDQRGHRQFVQRRGGKAVRLRFERSRRPQREDAHAVAARRAARSVPQSLPHHGRAAHHRHRTGRGRQAQGRLDVPDGACGGGGGLGWRAHLHRFHSRSHLAPAHGAGAAPIPEDGGDRPAHRRDRARFQQSAHRHHRQSGDAGIARRNGGPARDLAPRGLRNRAARRGAYRPAARLRPAPAAAAARRGSGRAPVAGFGLAAPDAGRKRRGADSHRQDHASLAGRSQPARKRASQPRHQRARRHARRRHADDRGLQRRHRRPYRHEIPICGRAATS